MRRLISGAWIMTAEGWVSLGQSPQVVFESDAYGQAGPIDFHTWLHRYDDFDGEPE